jgi:hypothetical protein
MPVGNSGINYYNSQDNKHFDRELFNNDMFDLLQKVNKVLNADSVIDKTERYTAVVLDNVDPNKLGRVKANVYGLFDNITDLAVLPWCVPELESMAGDQYIVPEVGQLIRVTFMDGDIYKPIFSQKVKTPMLFGDEGATKSRLNIDNDPVNQMVLFENEYSSLQYNKLTSQLVYKNSSGMVIQIAGDDTPGEGGTNAAGALMVKVGGDAMTSYSVRADESGFVITDGADKETFMVLDNTGKITNHSTKHSQMSSGDVSLSQDGTLGFAFTNPGQVAPDPAGIGPWNALPVDPMTGMPHGGNVFITSGASKDPMIVADSDIVGGNYTEADGSDFDAHSKS